MSPEHRVASEQNLDNKVTLLINGICESGRVLASMLAKQGSEIAIIDSRQSSRLAGRIQDEVKAEGRRCLILTPEADETRRQPFSRNPFQKIMATFGRIDFFISYGTGETDGSLIGQVNEAVSSST